MHNFDTMGPRADCDEQVQAKLQIEKLLFDLINFKQMANGMRGPQVETIDDYIKGFPEDVQKLLKQMRQIISSAAPKAGEAIKYSMPTFTHLGNLVHFAGYKNHIGFYPAPSGIQAFKKELSIYKNSKGAVQFPLDKPLPAALITKIVKFRLQESIALAELKPVKKKGRKD